MSFGSPVHVPVQLAGNFGEPRPNHFHGGIDVKTEREVNLGVYSIADGYVSGAIVEKFGYGHALMVTHPNGYTSYYFHLNRFAPQIEAAVKNGSMHIISLQPKYTSDRVNSLLRRVSL